MRLCPGPQATSLLADKLAATPLSRRLANLVARHVASSPNSPPSISPVPTTAAAAAALSATADPQDLRGVEMLMQTARQEIAF